MILWNPACTHLVHKEACDLGSNNSQHQLHEILLKEKNSCSLREPTYAPSFYSSKIILVCLMVQRTLVHKVSLKSFQIWNQSMYLELMQIKIVMQLFMLLWSFIVDLSKILFQWYWTHRFRLSLLRSWLLLHIRRGCHLILLKAPDPIPHKAIILFWIFLEFSIQGLNFLDCRKIKKFLQSIISTVKSRVLRCITN